MKIIIDFDGTLTEEEKQAWPLAELSLDTLAYELLNVPRAELAAEYRATREHLLGDPIHYWWEVNSLIASYCDEGAFILNTTTMQTMLQGNPTYRRALVEAFPEAEYDPVMDCVNHLFHRHTAELSPQFRPQARQLLETLHQHPARTPLILTNSMGDKVRRHLAQLDLDWDLLILGDTRQYDMDPGWKHHFDHPSLGSIQLWPVSPGRTIDLRRPAYYQALQSAAADGSQLAVVADTFSLPGAVPLMMDVPFFLLHTPYTPGWCVEAVETHPCGWVLPSLGELPALLDGL